MFETTSLAVVCTLVIFWSKIPCPVKTHGCGTRNYNDRSATSGQSIISVSSFLLNVHSDSASVFCDGIIPFDCCVFGVGIKIGNAVILSLCGTSGKV
ncbi:MAG: hypothetical protein ACD_29C00383G0001 [uncultured bacterium]|nr:MAG: hypothetical protein ACD_29C00383G0001 [uncultured bacterium]